MPQEEYIAAGTAACVFRSVDRRFSTTKPPRILPPVRTVRPHRPPGRPAATTPGEIRFGIHAVRLVRGVGNIAEKRGNPFFNKMSYLKNRQWGQRQLCRENGMNSGIGTPMSLFWEWIG
jgi:hypothetical protein